MIEELFSIGSFSISPFGLMLVMAFFASYMQLKRSLKAAGLGDEEDASAMLFAAGLGGILGGKIYYAILYRDLTLLFERYGIVWYGGFLLGALGVLWTLRRRRLPVMRTMDCAGPAMALGYAFGRVGCFLVGDDYGVPTDLPWGTEFKVGLPPTTAGNLQQYFGVEMPGVAANEMVAVHPTQLYETGAALIIWGFGLWLLRRAPRPGTVILSVLSLLALERFAVEFLRAKDDRFFGTLTLAQVISLVLLALFAVLALRRRPQD